MLRAVVENWRNAERLSVLWLDHLAAIGAPPFDDESTLVETLLRLWTSTQYGGRGPLDTGKHERPDGL